MSPAAASAAALELGGISVRFGGIAALSDVSLRIPAEPGISAVIGLNGAGKTTLFNVMTGLVAPTAGRILVAGRDMTGRRPDEIFRARVARTFQGIRLFEHLDAGQNVHLAARSACSSSGAGRLAAWIDWRGEAAERTRRARDDVQFDPALARVAPDRLTLLQRRQIEVARALTADPVALLLDEPAAGLNTAEKLQRGRLLERLVVRRACRIVVVEHDMKLVMTLAERISVMNFGRLLCEGTPQAIRSDPAVIAAYLGGEAAHV